MNEMEALRISEELHRQTVSQHSFNRHSKDSGVIDIDMLTPTDPTVNRLSAPECRGGLKKNTLSNSLIDLSEGKFVSGKTSTNLSALLKICWEFEGLLIDW